MEMAGIGDEEEAEPGDADKREDGNVDEHSFIEEEMGTAHAHGAGIDGDAKVAAESALLFENVKNGESAMVDSEVVSSARAHGPSIICGNFID